MVKNKRFRVMFSSNAMWSASGYGQQMFELLPHLKDRYDIALVCFFGLEGGRINLNGIDCFPRVSEPSHYGSDAVLKHSKIWGADIVITFQDIWVLNPNHVKQFKNWIPLCVDGETLVTMADGSQKKISDIVENKLEEDVLGFDGIEVVKTKIKAWQKIPYKMDVYELKTSERTLLVTGNNEIFVNGKWKRADCVNSGDVVYCIDNEPLSNKTTKINKDGMGLYSWDNRRRGNNNDPESIEGKEKDRQQKTYNSSNVIGNEHQRGINRLDGKEDRDKSQSKTQEYGKQIQSINGKIIQRNENSLCDINSGLQRTSNIREDNSIFDSKKRESISSKRVYKIKNKKSEKTVQPVIHQKTDRLMGKGQNIKFEVVLAVKKVKAPKRTVYDISTETGNFFANQILIHNCPIDHDPVPPRIHDMLKQAYRIITYSQFGHDELQRVGLHSTFIPHTVDTNLFVKSDKKEIRKKLGIPEDIFLFGMVAANKDTPPRKSFQQCMDAFKMFKDKHPKSGMYFHSILEQPAGFPISHYAQHIGIRDCIYYVDAHDLMYTIGHHDMPKIYSALDCLLMPSTNEGFGIPAIEAQSCEVPVITNDFTAMSELVIPGKTGYLCKNMWKRFTPLLSYISHPTVESIYENMEKVFKADRVKMGIAGRKYIKKNYDTKTIVENHWFKFLDKVQAEIN